MNEPRHIEFVILAEEAGKRLDKLVIAHIPKLGRRAAGQLFDAGLVTVAGRRARKGDLAHAGAEVRVQLLEPDVPASESNESLEVRLERPEFVVVNKPAGVPTAPLDTLERGTLVNRLLARYPEMRGVGHRARESGLIHRLDTQTSGLVVAARSQSAFERLRAALEHGELKKRYLAIVSTHALKDSGRIDLALGPDPKQHGRVRVVDAWQTSDYFRNASTQYRIVKRVSELTLVELSVERAFRHQIRVHLAAIGAPIVGDRLYGGDLTTSLAERHALHASYVAWAGDATLAGFTIEEPLPRDMAELLGL